MSVIVRPATRADVAAIADLDTTSFVLVPWSPVMLAEGVAGIVPGLSYVVAERDGEFLGYAATSVVGGDAELQRIAVAESARRLGVGAALVRAACEVARNDGASRLLLEVHEANESAQALYAATGFTELARRPRYFRDGSTAIVLVRGWEDGVDD